MRDLLPYALAVAVGAIYFRIAVVLLSYIASDQETGIYSAAFRVIEVLTAIPMLIVSTGFPILARAARDDADRLRYALQRLFDIATLCGAGMAVVMILGAPFAIDVVAGANYEGSIAVLRVLGVALLTSFVAATWSFALLSLREHTQLLVSNAIAVVLTAGGVLVLEPLLGALGAATATVIGEAALVFCYLVGLASQRRQLLPQSGGLIKVAVSAGTALAVLAFPMASVLQAAVGGVAYLAVAYALGAVPPELVDALRSRR